MGLVGVQVTCNNIETSKHNLIGKKYCCGKSLQKVFLQMEKSKMEIKMPYEHAFDNKDICLKYF